ncbi:hypothetical protein CEXT_417371 [Caerostris extrusa]|uniref:Uncharacterized protein n=1 Tax=Caerostris extrusa TaxID=172846 RepID=A0AAV4NNV8_CAEEX|nr:hypothetical protein CEXT_417371 [Caerostris extrusa]
MLLGDSTRLIRSQCRLVGSFQEKKLNWAEMISGVINFVADCWAKHLSLHTLQLHQLQQFRLSTRSLKACIRKSSTHEKHASSRKMTPCAELNLPEATHSDVLRESTRLIRSQCRLVGSFQKRNSSGRK